MPNPETLKTLTTASPLNAPFHEALEAADLETLRAALEAKGLKAAAKKAIQARLNQLESQGEPQAMGPGAKYKPASPPEGEAFMRRFCDECAVLAPDGGCAILDATSLKATDPDYPAEWTFDPEGDPVCTAFKAQDAQGEESPPWEGDPRASEPAGPPAPDFAGMMQAGGEPPPPEPTPAATGEISPEFLVKTALSTIKRNIGVLTGHGWTESDVIAALADMLPGRSKEGAIISELSSSPREERFPAGVLLGELIAAATKQLKLCMVPWNTMPEEKQKDVLGRVRQDCETAAKNALRTFAAEARTNFVASLDNVQFKPNGVVAKITIGRNHFAHLLADAAGQEIEVVLVENFDMYSGTGSAMKTDPDQREMFMEGAA